MPWDWWNSGYQESITGQAVQKPWATNYANACSSKCCGPQTLLLLYHGERWVISQPCIGICTRNDLSSFETLQSCQSINAPYLCEAIYLPGEQQNVDGRNLKVIWCAKDYMIAS